MRTLVKKQEWDSWYYHSRQIDGQCKIESESEEQEIEKVQYCLNNLQKIGALDSTDYNLEQFREFREKVHKNFFIYWTAINPPMEHLLYALSDILKPKNILGIGIFTGNPVIWSLGPALMGSYVAKKLAAVEINKKHAKICQDNMDKVSEPGKVKVWAKDGFKILNTYQDEEIDLLYLDANGRDPLAETWMKRRVNTKRINYSLLKLGYSKIRSGGYAMCHNAYQPSFSKHASDYLKFTDDTNYFTKTATIAIDEMGLEYSIKNGSRVRS